MTRPQSGFVLLVRHAESIWNATGRWQGRADPPLSATGEAQAHSAAASARLDDVVAVWTSPLTRARRTAELLAAARGWEVRADDRLVERDAGEWSGLTRDEIEKGWPGYLAEGLRPPGFEADASLLARAWAALVDLVTRMDTATVEESGAVGEPASRVAPADLLDSAARVDRAPLGSERGDVLVVAHGGVIRAVERRLGVPMRRLANLEGRYLEAAEPFRPGGRFLLVDPDTVAVTAPVEADAV